MICKLMTVSCYTKLISKKVRCLHLSLKFDLSRSELGEM